MAIPNSSSHIDETKESWYLGDFNQDSILSHHLEIEQFQTFDTLASFHFNEIELDCECERDPQLCNLVSNFEFMLTPISLPNLGPIIEPTLIPIPIDFEIKPLILDNHILLMDHECELIFLYLDSTLGPK